MTTTINYAEKDRQLELGLDFIIAHFEDSHFPRTISTKRTEGRQVLVYSKEDALLRFRQANYQDCRINAYPDYSGRMEKKVNFIFIDIDQEQFETEEELVSAVSNCLKVINKRFNPIGTNDPLLHPTILWTGGGYHLYLPIDGIDLEEAYPELNKFGETSAKFLKFASTYFSKGNSDPNNHPSLKSCLLRIPSTINTKSGNEVKIIQRWNGIRPNIECLLGSLRLELTCERIREQNKLKQLAKSKYRYGNSNTIFWIETLLKIPIKNFRKNTVDLILTPYLIHIRKLEPNEVYKIIYNWLSECNKDRTLNFNADSKINYAINRAIQEKKPPMGLEKLKNRDKIIYDLVTRG